MLLRYLKWLALCASVSVWMLLSACSPRSENQAGARAPEAFQLGIDAETFVYDCAEDYCFVACVEKNFVWLFLPTKTVSLPRVPSGVGDKFSDGKIMFWSRNQEALLKIADNVQYSCVNNPLKAVWEHAKLTGVDFRAVGNEPGRRCQDTMSGEAFEVSVSVTLDERTLTGCGRALH